MQTSVMQTEAWAEFKGQFGWQWRYIKQLYVLKRPLRAGFNFVYIPEIIVPETATATSAAEAVAALSHMRDRKTIFGRAEYLVPYSDSAHTRLLQAGFVKSKDEVQPAWRQVIDLKPAMHEIRIAMKQKGRYNVGVAEKHGVVVTEDSSEEAIEAFLQIHNQTISRQKIHGRGSEYMRTCIQTLQESGMGGLWVARYQNSVLAAAVVTLWGERASYLYGASSAENRNTMAPYLLHYTIMETAKRKGCTLYDMIGVAPPDAGDAHPWAGISRFKREFGGETVRYLGSYDRVYRPVLYTAYSRLRSQD